MNQFPCTQCGACCKSIASVEFLSEFDDGRGKCKYLDDVSNKCEIYSKRPLLCRIDEAYEQFFYENFTKREYYKMNAEACNKMQIQAGISEKYRVKLF